MKQVIDISIGSHNILYGQEVYRVSIRLDMLKYFQSPTWMNGTQSTNASP